MKNSAILRHIASGIEERVELSYEMTMLCQVRGLGWYSVSRGVLICELGDEAKLGYEIVKGSVTGFDATYFECCGYEALKQLKEFEAMVASYENGVCDPELL